MTKSFSGYEPDPLLEDAVKLIIQHDQASASLLQRRLSVGYARAARLLDALEMFGVIAAGEGARPRDVLIRSFEDFHKGGIPNPEPVEDPKDHVLYRLPEIHQYIHDPAIVRALSPALPALLPVGWDNGTLVSESLSSSPHALLTGNPTSRKYDYLESVLTALITCNSPANLQLVLLDGAKYLSPFNGIPHLLTPVVDEPDKVLAALRWGISEMERRYRTYRDQNQRGITHYNSTAKNPHPHILYVITQADGFLHYSPEDMRDCLKQVTSLGSRTGIHVLLATDFLSNSTVPAEIRANIPFLIQFKSTPHADPRSPAAKLPPDDLLYQTDAMETNKQLRAFFIMENEREEIITYWKNQK